jgi:magnesium-transporting ATPase (P-type)
MSMQVPSISMAHESAEADIMKLPPRQADERLVSIRLIHCTYLQAGAISAAGAFYAYFVVLGSSGFRPYDVIGLRDAWEDPSIQDLRDSYGQEWVIFVVHISKSSFATLLFYLKFFFVTDVFATDVVGTICMFCLFCGCCGLPVA